jgi:hypothetical protein
MPTQSCHLAEPCSRRSLQSNLLLLARRRFSVASHSWLESCFILLLHCAVIQVYISKDRYVEIGAHKTLWTHDIPQSHSVQLNFQDSAGNLFHRKRWIRIFISAWGTKLQLDILTQNYEKWSLASSGRSVRMKQLVSHWANFH